MTTLETRAPGRLTMRTAALLGALALAGCSSGNIGESWQCPLAKGGSCDSIAAADPAVPNQNAASGTVLGEPLWRVRGSAPASEPGGQAPEAACEAGCGGGFDPFGWLWRLIADIDGGGESPAAGQPEPATAGAEREAPPARAVPEAALASPAASEAAESRPVEPAAAVLPAGQPSLQGEPAAAKDGPRADDLRTNEIVARIWIAPFVDGDGVYREASHVRVVLEPAGWRLK